VICRETSYIHIIPIKSFLKEKQEYYCTLVISLRNSFSLAQKLLHTFGIWRKGVMITVLNAALRVASRELEKPIGVEAAQMQGND